jgi:hypothetical protein
MNNNHQKLKKRVGLENFIRITIKKSGIYSRDDV